MSHDKIRVLTPSHYALTYPLQRIGAAIDWIVWHATAGRCDPGVGTWAMMLGAPTLETSTRRR